MQAKSVEVHINKANSFAWKSEEHNHGYKGLEILCQKWLGTGDHSINVMGNYSEFNINVLYMWFVTQVLAIFLSYVKITQAWVWKFHFQLFSTILNFN
jgi:hypothetical protein